MKSLGALDKILPTPSGLAAVIFEDGGIGRSVRVELKIIIMMRENLR